MGTVEFDGNNADAAGADALIDTVQPDESGAKPAAKPAVPGAMYTMLAREGVHAAQLINAVFAKRTLGKGTPRRLEVAAPLGQSTSGGKKARQAITLIPVANDAASVMCGWIDAAQKTAELREYRSLAEQYQWRFGTPIELTLEEYSALLKDLENMLKTLGFEVDREEFETSLPPPSRTGIWTTLAWVVGAALLGAVIALALT